jgi:ATP phosphoribosyltransferase regulatory subunit HisZ
LPELESLTKALSLTAKQQEAYMALPQLFGNPKETILKAKQIALSTEAVSAIDHIEKLYETLLDYGLDSSMLRVDFSFTNTYSYYTDTIYKIYTADSGQVLAAGGRYDDAFGYGLAACGIALYLNEINEVIEMKQQKNSNLFSKDFAIYYDTPNRKNAYQLSDLLRELGYVVTTSVESFKEITELPQTDAEEILKINAGQLEIINQRMNTFSRSSFEQFVRKVENQYVPNSIH